MDQTRTRPSLLARIVQAQEQARLAPDASPAAPRKETSFVERYRGTEYETPSLVVVAEAPPARGHAYVWVTLSAMMATAALIIGASTL